MKGGDKNDETNNRMSNCLHGGAWPKVSNRQIPVRQRSIPLFEGHPLCQMPHPKTSEEWTHCWTWKALVLDWQIWDTDQICGKVMLHLRAVSQFKRYQNGNEVFPALIYWFLTIWQRYCKYPFKIFSILLQSKTNKRKEPIASAIGSFLLYCDYKPRFT